MNRIRYSSKICENLQYYENHFYDNSIGLLVESIIKLKHNICKHHDIWIIHFNLNSILPKVITDHIRLEQVMNNDNYMYMNITLLSTTPIKILSLHLTYTSKTIPNLSLTLSLPLLHWSPMTLTSMSWGWSDWQQAISQSLTCPGPVNKIDYSVMVKTILLLCTNDRCLVLGIKMWKLKSALPNK